MEGAIVNGTIAKESYADGPVLEQFGTVPPTACLEDTGADDPASAHHPDFRREQMHAPAPTARAAGRTTEQLRNQFPRRQSLRQSMPVPAVRAEDGIPVAKV